MPALGGVPRRVVEGDYAIPSPDGAYIYYAKSNSGGIFRADRSGLNEERVFEEKDPNLYIARALVYPGGKELLFLTTLLPDESPRHYGYFCSARLESVVAFFCFPKSDGDKLAY